MLRCNTAVEGLDWLPQNGVVPTRSDLERVFLDLRALISGTDPLEANRAHAADIAVTMTQAFAREGDG